MPSDHYWTHLTSRDAKTSINVSCIRRYGRVCGLFCTGIRCAGYRSRFWRLCCCVCLWPLTFCIRNVGMYIPVTSLSSSAASSCMYLLETGIKADNIMLGITDDTVLTDFETEEHHSPSPRKGLSDRRTIYILWKSPDKWAPRSSATLARPCPVTGSIWEISSLIPIERRRWFWRFRDRIVLRCGMWYVWYDNPITPTTY